MKEQNEIQTFVKSIADITKTELFKKSTVKRKILLFSYFEADFSQPEVVQKFCHHVTPVTSVTSFEKTGDKGDKGDMVTSVLRDSVKQSVYRLEKEMLLSGDESHDKKRYSITEKGKEEVIKIISKWKEQVDFQKKRKDKKDSLRDIKNAFDELFTRKLDEIIANYQSGYSYAEINLKYIHLDPEIHEAIIEKPDEYLKIAKLSLSDILSQNGIEEEAHLKITDLPDSSQLNVTKIRARHLSSLVSVTGEVRSRGNSSLQITGITFECPSCAERQEILQTKQKQQNPKICKNCGFKGKFIEKESKIDDFMRVTIHDLYERLSPNEVPEELNCFLQKDLFNFSKINEGDKVQIYGIATPDEKTDNKGQKNLTQAKVFRCLGLKHVDDSFADELISRKDEERFKEIAQNPLEHFKNNLFPDLDDVDHAKEMAIIGLFGDLHILFVGSPGTGKTEIGRRSSEVALRGKFANCSTSSPSGILGSVTRNEFTGKYGIDGGVLRPIHPGGLVSLDEINRDNDKELQKSILGVMNDRRININKANTRIDEPCDVSIWATANPLKESSYHKAHDIFGMIEPLFDRFDFVIYFTNKLDIGDSTLVENLLRKTDSKQKWDPNTEEVLLLRKYLLKASKLEVEFKQEDFQKLARLMKEILPSFEDSPSYRRINTIRNTLSAIAKMHHREQVISDDYKILTELLRKLKEQRSMFNAKLMKGEE